MKNIIITNTITRVCVLVAFILTLSLPLNATLFSGGNGTKEDPWQIATAGDLDDIRNYPDSSFIQVVDIDLTTWGSWVPIEDFTGVFNGNYYKIVGLTISTNNDYAGLFADNSGKLIRLQVEGEVITDNSYGGLVVGRNNEDGVIIFSSSFGEVNGGNFAPYIGGLVGRNEGMIVESYSSANVEVGSNSTYSGAGGLVGLNTGTIKNSYSFGSAIGVYDVGGFVAYNNGGTIKNCYSIGAVNPSGGITIRETPDRNDPGCKQTGRSLYIGGFIGYNYFQSSVTNSYWNTETSGISTSAVGEPRYTSEMTYPYDQDTYVDWDFINVWTENDYEVLNGYPFLICAPDDNIVPHPMFSGGTGVENDPWLIERPMQLNYMRGFGNSYFRLISDIDLSGYNADGGWRPIGWFKVGEQNTCTPFRGVFDGNGHSISNLSINRGEDYYQGLFGVAGFMSKITNVTLNNVDIKGKELVGALVGWILDADLISNITVSGDVFGNRLVGGLSGESLNNIGHGYETHIDNIVVSGEVSGESDISQYIGGILGSHVGSSILDNSSSNNIVSGNQSVGGIVGFNASLITNCSTSAWVVRSGEPLSGAISFGGLIGSNFRYPGHGIIERCSSSGVILSGKGGGGLIGVNDGDIVESYSTATVIVNSVVAGGLAGTNSGLIKNCYTGCFVCSDSNTVIGGLVGNNSGDIYCCYSASSLDAENSLTVGGLIGIHDDVSGSITDSYWDIEVSGQDFSAGGIGLTTYQMLNYYSFDNWTFTMGLGTQPVWANWSTKNWSPYVLKSYPYLHWQGEPGPHNYPDFIDGETHVKYFVDNRYTHWESFPRLEEEDDWDYTEELLEQILNENDGIYSVSNWNFNVPEPQYMHYRYQGELTGWTPVPGVTLNNLDGFFFDFLSPPSRGYLQVSGNWNPRTKIIELDDFIQTHWIGYPYRQTQSLFSAIAPFEEYIEYVQGQDGGIYRDGNGNWIPYLDTNVYYGKMYEIVFKESPILPFHYAIEFDWAVYRNKEEEKEEDFDYVDHHFNRPRPQYFSFTDSRHYEEFFIEDIENDEGVLEIGAFVGEECVGAAVFTGKYPIRLMAYTDERHSERELSFKLHRGTRSDSQDHIKLVEVKNEQTGYYEQKVVQSLKQKYARIRLGVDDYTETPPTPQIAMGQNYPNPFVAGSVKSSGIRTRSENVIATNIPVYISRDMNVDLSVFNIKGQKVKTLTSGILTSGKHTFTWDGRNEQNQPVSAGVYFYKLECDIETVNKKMLIVR